MHCARVRTPLIRGVDRSSSLLAAQRALFFGSLARNAEACAKEESPSCVRHSLSFEQAVLKVFGPAILGKPSVVMLIRTMAYIMQ